MMLSSDTPDTSSLSPDYFLTDEHAAIIPDTNLTALSVKICKDGSICSRCNNISGDAGLPTISVIRNNAASRHEQCQILKQMKPLLPEMTITHL
jgi:hypothetical protein